MLKFIITSVLISVLLVAVTIMGFDKGWFIERPSFLFETQILILIFTVVIFYYLRRASQPLFTQLYLLTMVLKILGYGAYVFAILFLDPMGARANVVFFLTSYMLFTLLEVVFLYRFLVGRKTS